MNKHDLAKEIVELMVANGAIPPRGVREGIQEWRQNTKPPSYGGMYAVVMECLNRVTIPGTANVALFDMDGSLADYVGALAENLNKLAGPNEPIVTPDNLFALEQQAYIGHRMRLIKQQPNFWTDLEPIRQGMQALELAQTVGFDVHILTKGPKKIPNAWKEKVEWCQEHLHEDTDIHITSDKGLVYGKVLYDDYPEYMLRWLKHRTRGLGIMPVTPYNKDFKHPNVVMWDGTNIEELTHALTAAFSRQSGEELVWKQ